MPTYEYVCEKCGHEFEQFQSMAADPLTQCPADRCARKPWGKGKVRKQISAGAGLIFKGSGFYITDYRSDNYKEGAKKDAPPAKGDGKGEGKSTSSASGSDSKTPGTSTSATKSSDAGKSSKKPKKT